MEKAVRKDLTEKRALEKDKNMREQLQVMYVVGRARTEGPKQEKICFFWVTERRPVLSG